MGCAWKTESTVPCDKISDEWVIQGVGLSQVRPLSIGDYRTARQGVCHFPQLAQCHARTMLYDDEASQNNGRLSELENA